MEDNSLTEELFKPPLQHYHSEKKSRNITISKYPLLDVTVGCFIMLITFNVENNINWGWEKDLIFSVDLVAHISKNPLEKKETWVLSLVPEDPLEKGMATHSSILAWRIPWTEEPGGLQSMGSQRVVHDWMTNTFPVKLSYC